MYSRVTGKMERASSCLIPSMVFGGTARDGDGGVGAKAAGPLRAPTISICHELKDKRGKPAQNIADRAITHRNRRREGQRSPGGGLFFPRTGHTGRTRGLFSRQNRGSARPRRDSLAGGTAYKKCCTFSLRRGMITYHNRGGSPQRAARRCAPSRARGVERFLCVSARSALYITQRQKERRRAGAGGERVPGSGLPDSAGARTQAADRRPFPGETGPEGSRRTAPPSHAPHDPGAGAAP